MNTSQRRRRKKSQKLKKKSQTIKHLFVNKLNHTQVEFDSPSNEYAKVLVLQV